MATPSRLLRQGGAGAFNRLDTIMDELDAWFFSDVELADAIDQYCGALLLDFVEDPYGEDVDKSIGVRRTGWYVFKYTAPDISVTQQNAAGAALLRAKDIHSKFEAVFEGLLAARLRRAGLEAAAFVELHRIAGEDEGEGGAGFHRWVDATSFEEFGAAMHALCTARLRDAPEGVTAVSPALRPLPSCEFDIPSLSNTTRTAASTDSCGGDAALVGGGAEHSFSNGRPPAVVTTCSGVAMSCAALVDAAEPPLSPSELFRARAAALAAQAKEDRRRRREILPLIDEWDVDSFAELCAFLHADDAPPDEAPCGPVAARKALAAFRHRLLQAVPHERTGVYTARMVAREDMARYVTAHTRCLSAAGYLALQQRLHNKVASLPLTPERAARRAVWRAFHTLDVGYARRVPLAFVLQIAGQHPGLQSKAHRKVLARCQVRARQREAEAGAGNGIGAMQGVSMTRTIDLEEFRGLLTELAGCSTLAACDADSLANDFLETAAEMQRRGRLRSPRADAIRRAHAH